MEIVKISTSKYEIKMPISNGRQGEQGIQGIQGPKGEKGATGKSALALDTDFYYYNEGDNIKNILESSDEKYQNIDFRGIYAELSGISLNGLYKNIRNLNVYVSEKERLMNVTDCNITFKKCQIIVNNPQNGHLISADNSFINLDDASIECRELICTDWTMFYCKNAIVQMKKTLVDSREINAGDSGIKKLKLFNLDADIVGKTSLNATNSFFNAIYTSDNNNGADIIYINPQATVSIQVNLTFCSFVNHNKGGTYANDFNVRLDDDIHLRGNMIGYIFVRNENLSASWQPNTEYGENQKLSYENTCYQTLYAYTSSESIEDDINNGYLRERPWKMEVNKGNSIDGTNNQSFL